MSNNKTLMRFIARALYFPVLRERLHSNIFAEPVLPPFVSSIVLQEGSRSDSRTHYRKIFPQSFRIEIYSITKGNGQWARDSIGGVKVRQDILIKTVRFVKIIWKNRYGHMRSPHVCPFPGLTCENSHTSGQGGTAESIQGNYPRSPNPSSD